MRKRRVASPLSRRVRRVARPHTGLWRLRYARYPGSRLRSGNPAAQVAVRLVLLGSPPDTVHGAALRGTDPSSLLTWVRRHIAVPGAGIHPCCSGLQVQGTANSPTSAALPRAGRIRAVPGRLVLLSYIISARLSILFFDFLKSPPEYADVPLASPQNMGESCPEAALPHVFSNTVYASVDSGAMSARSWAMLRAWSPMRSKSVSSSEKMMHASSEQAPCRMRSI